MPTAHYDKDYICRTCNIQGLHIAISTATWCCDICKSPVLISIDHNGTIFTVKRLEPALINIQDEVRLDSFPLGTFENVLNKKTLKGGVISLTIKTHAKASYSSSDRITVLINRGWKSLPAPPPSVKTI